MNGSHQHHHSRRWRQYVETTSNHSKLCNFAASSKIIRNIIKLSRRFFLHNINENMQKSWGNILASVSLLKTCIIVVYYNTFCPYKYFSIQFLPGYVKHLQKMKFSIKDFFSICDQIRSFLRVWSHLLKKYFMENFIFCAVKSDNSKMIKLYKVIFKSG